MSQDVNKVEKIIEKGLLYDFYGELLTDHQKSIYEALVLEDYSLSEIAEMYGISRQGVHDLVRRCSKQLNSYEERLHLVEKFLYIKEHVNHIQQLTSQYEQMDMKTLLSQIEQITGEILEEL